MTDDERVLARLRALADLRRWADLEAEARAGLSTMQHRSDVHAHLARALLLQDRPEDAIAVAEAALAQHGDDDWLGRVLASAYVAADRVGDAERVLALLLARAPDSYHVRVLAARVALRRLDPEAARDHARQAVVSDGSRAGGYVMLAAALTQLGQPSEAESVARQGLAIDPASGDLHCQLAVALERNGRRAEAAEHWVEAGRVGRYPDVAVDGLRQLMVDAPLTWLWAAVAVVSLVVSSVAVAWVVDDAWTTGVATIAATAVLTLALTPVLAPIIRRRRRAALLEQLPREARAAIALRGGDERV